jgi:hypothetical protein
MNETAPQLESDALEAAVDALAAGDPPWLSDARRAAWARWLALPLPSRVEHLWRYTDPAKLLPEGMRLAPRETTFGELPDDFHDGTYENAAAYAICRDGVLLRSTVDPALTDGGFVVADVRDAAVRHPEFVRPLLFSLSDAADGVGAKFDALSAALFAGGAVVHVPKGAE